MVSRLDQLEADLLGRKQRAVDEHWLGEIEGIDRTLTCLRGKRDDARRLAHDNRSVSLGITARVAGSGWSDQ
ncbi:hypothetical protein P9209_24470 [Prescottella defluvii]|nr:hypothetical protein P9209_24470 [Prescottella defluvii]